jgi:hypothetical protein
MSGIQNAFGFMRGAGLVSVTQTYASNVANVSLNVSTLSGYVAGNSCITITVNSGVYIYSVNCNPALLLTGGATGDKITIVNKGYIMGRGGYGNTACTTFRNGKPAIKLGFNTTIDNTFASAYIGGGGGAGGYFSCSTRYGGGGAGGGNGGTDAAGDGGGSGGSVGASGGNGAANPIFCCCTQQFKFYGSAGGGGRIFPGTGGAGGCWNGRTAGQGGGSGGGGGVDQGIGGAGGGGAGGSGSCNGVQYQFPGFAGGGGGGWGASGGNGKTGVGNVGGKAVCLNGKSVTWQSGCTIRVYGAIS